MTQETHFAKTPDGVYLAYQAVGSGAIDMVMDLHAFAGNVDLIWDEPDWGPLLTGLTEFARLIIHDRRGSGASTRNTPPPNLETRAADLLTVLDEVGSEAPVLGAGASTGAMHALFAATYPDRASGIVWNYPRPDDANTIGTTYLRAQTLAEPMRSRSLQLLRQYTDASLALSHAVPTTSGFATKLLNLLPSASGAKAPQCPMPGSGPGDDG